MLIKEYRIGLPLSVEEYRIAQLYMIQKKSREETSGSGSGVEIKINEPYTDGPGGDGQYTHKIYHIGSHLPGWFRSILPKSALRVEEVAWNAYPYTRTIYTCPFIEKFSLEIETRYLNDGGEEDNIFNLSTSELRERVVDYLDIVKDPISSGDYRKEEDPKLYTSEQTGRGPLTETWWQEHKRKNCMMVAYKLCKVEFKYWGMQSKIERFIHDIGLRKTMLRAHRQAWAWQDEYHGLTMDDIRRLERETQLALEEKMAAQQAAEDEADSRGNGSGRKSTHRLTRRKSNSPRKSPSPPKSFIRNNASNESFQSVVSQKTLTEDTVSGTGSREPATSGFTPTHSRPSQVEFSHRQSWCSTRSRFSENQSECLEQLRNSSSDEEFFDAQEDFHVSEEKPATLCKSSSMEILPSESDFCDASTVLEGDEGSALDRRLRQLQTLQHQGSLTNQDMSPSTPSYNTCKTTILFLVLHGGSVMDTGLEYKVSKFSDIATLKSTLDTVISAHYPALIGHLAVRMVACPPICSQTLSTLASLNPYSFDVQTPTVDNSVVTNDNFPQPAIPLFVTNSPEYLSNVSQVIQRLNAAYGDFLQSDEGTGFSGQVCLIADSVGSVMGYDALCKNPPTPHNFSSQANHRHEDSASEDDQNQNNQDQNKSSSGLSYSNPDLTVTEFCDNDLVEESTKSNPRLLGQKVTTQRLTSCPVSRRTSTGSQSGDYGKFDFDVSDFFMLGSPLGLVLAYRRMCSMDDAYCIPRPACHQIYNLFYPSDPGAIRIEPLLNDHFKLIPPMKIPRYQKFPLGDGLSVHVVETIQSNAAVFLEPPSSSHSHDGPSLERRQSNLSIASQVSGQGDFNAANITSVISRWWGNKRLDYALYYPDALQSFPTIALPYLLHASCWESTDIVAFLLRQVVRQDFSNNVMSDSQKECTLFRPTQPREKWLKRRTTIKLRNVAPNHRGNDIIVLEDKPQVLTARFMYGPLDMVSLSGEKVDIHLMRSMSSGEWEYFDTTVTDSNGRAMYEVPDNKRLPQGIYPVKMIVRGDHTCVDLNLAVLPPKTETVVFSIDGSFTASVSIMGKDPKVRPGAVDVVRYWQELGYLIIYITARPDMQQKKVVAWLAQHNFPHGMVTFMDGLSADPIRQKANYISKLVQEADISIHAGYGSSKDIIVYQTVAIPNRHIFIVGKVSKKNQKEINVILDGYAVHLAQLASMAASRPATGNARMFLRKGCFSLPGQNKNNGKKNLRKTMSLPQRHPSFREAGSASKPMIAVSETGNTVVEAGLAISRTTRGASPRKLPASRFDSNVT